MKRKTKPTGVSWAPHCQCQAVTFVSRMTFLGEVKRSVKMISLIWTLGHFFHNRTSSAGHSGFMPSPPEHLHSE